MKIAQFCDVLTVSLPSRYITLEDPLYIGYIRVCTWARSILSKGNICSFYTDERRKIRIPLRNQLIYKYSSAPRLYFNIFRRSSRPTLNMWYHNLITEEGFGLLVNVPLLLFLKLGLRPSSHMLNTAS